jgi:Arc/MetJ-type ribon-helix-helix transcriptional regulator
MNVSLLNYEPTVRSRIRSGEFANASEYIRHCIRVAEAVEARSGPRGASFATRQELEHLLDAGMSSPGAPVTPGRKREIYQRARR